MTTKSNTENRPFKKLYCDEKDLFLLPSPALKIWVYLYSREGQERQSWPSVSTIAKETGLNDRTVQRYKQFLISYGWLVQIGTKMTPKGGVPILRVKRGMLPQGCNSVTPKGNGGVIVSPHTSSTFSTCSTVGVTETTGMGWHKVTRRGGIKSPKVDSIEVEPVKVEKTEKNTKNLSVLNTEIQQTGIQQSIESLSNTDKIPVLKSWRQWEWDQMTENEKTRFTTGISIRWGKLSNEDPSTLQGIVRMWMNKGACYYDLNDQLTKSHKLGLEVSEIVKRVVIVDRPEAA